MDEEVAGLKKEMTVTSTSTIASMEFLEGTLLEKRLLLCAVGLVRLMLLFALKF